MEAQKYSTMRRSLPVLVSLGVGAVAGMVFATGMPIASAAPDAGKTPFNSAGQRNEMIKKLGNIESRLSRIESKLNAGINVKVTDMPAIQIREDRSRQRENQ